MACLLDVTAAKPGNVHRGADFADTTFLDYAASAVAIGPAMRDAAGRGVGPTVLDAIRATRAVTPCNTNLGIVLLLAPLAATNGDGPWKSEIQRVLSQLSTSDTANVYKAIRLTNPGGLGTVDRMDVHQSAPTNLVEAMGAAADRDLVARQYVSDFGIVLDDVAPRLQEQCGRWGLISGIVDTFVFLLSCHVDSLIVRKCGLETAKRASSMSAQVLDTSDPHCEEYQQSLSDLDFWLRSDGNRRNPGTMADLVTAGLFVVLRDQRVRLKDSQ
jgi:triphosphoribosyl-dephospho-CoA synthase